ncbi:YflJ family protein [Pradoshia sp.]
MAYIGSKGWYVVKLRELGVTKHPIERRKLELYKTYILRQLYEQVREKKRISPM